MKSKKEIILEIVLDLFLKAWAKDIQTRENEI